MLPFEVIASICFIASPCSSQCDVTRNLAAQEQPANVPHDVDIGIECEGFDRVPNGEEMRRSLMPDCVGMQVSVLSLGPCESGHLGVNSRV